MSLRLLLTISGGLEILAGLPALSTPALAVSLLLGSPLDSIGVVLTRLFGAGVFALGLACLKARNDVGSPAGRAVSIGITAYNVLAAVVLVWTAAGLSLGGLLLWGAGIGHAALGALFVSALVMENRCGVPQGVNLTSGAQFFSIGPTLARAAGSPLRSFLLS